MNNPQFPLGKTVATPGALDLLTNEELYTLLHRHSSGDWGDMCQDDKDLNDHALAMGEGRLFSSYVTGKGRIWVITEADRSITTVLLPSEY